MYINNYCWWIKVYAYLILMKHNVVGTKCGFSASAPHRGRIVGGDEAEPHSWPWQALIVCRNFLVTKHCGGSIISDKWVITAAHCV